MGGAYFAPQTPRDLTSKGREGEGKGGKGKGHASK